MTHDELLEKIDNQIFIPFGVKMSKTLRAVVELHKPTHFIKKDGVITEMWCVCGGEVLTKYPCPTIQAIEKELQ
jgi:hypothetical protein